VKGITIRNAWGVNIKDAGVIWGLKNSPFTDICLSVINFNASRGLSPPTWKCSDVSGFSYKVSPSPCPQLSSQKPRSCGF